MQTLHESSTHLGVIMQIFSALSSHFRGANLHLIVSKDVAICNYRFYVSHQHVPFELLYVTIFKLDKVRLG